MEIDVRKIPIEVKRAVLAEYHHDSCSHAGRAGVGASKVRGGSAYYKEIVRKRWAKVKCPECGAKLDNGHCTHCNQAGQ